MADPFGDLAQSAADTSFTLVGRDDAILLPVAGGDPLSVRIVPLKEAVLLGEFGQQIEMRDSFAFLLTETSPVRGDQVTIGAAIYRLDGVVEGGDDGIVRRMFVLRVIPPAAKLVNADSERLLTADSDYLMAV